MSGYHTDKYISEIFIVKNPRPIAEGTSLASTGKKSCPVCDTPVPADARKCPSCDTDLTLFDIDMDGELDVDKIEISDEKAIDDILSSIVGKDESSKLLEDIRTIGKESDLNDEDEVITADEPDAEEEEVSEEGAAFECPSCGSMVGADETSCPNCGVEFAEEEALEFECPVCNAPVAANADNCGNCGVKFEAAEEEEEEKRQNLLRNLRLRRYQMTRSNLWWISPQNRSKRRLHLRKRRSRPSQRGCLRRGRRD
jgi:RNA polymerase subunit RPABC4/transcription elongation factor Spt4